MLKFNPGWAENILFIFNISGKPLFLNENPLLGAQPRPPTRKGGAREDKFLHGRQFRRASSVSCSSMTISKRLASGTSSTSFRARSGESEKTTSVLILSEKIFKRLIKEGGIRGYGTHPFSEGNLPFSDERRLYFPHGCDEGWNSERISSAKSLKNTVHSESSRSTRRDGPYPDGPVRKSGFPVCYGIRITAIRTRGTRTPQIRHQLPGVQIVPPGNAASHIRSKRMGVSGGYLEQMSACS